jgi:hypothetical protein
MPPKGGRRAAVWRTGERKREKREREREAEMCQTHYNIAA